MAGRRLILQLLLVLAVALPATAPAAGAPRLSARLTAAQESPPQAVKNPRAQGSFRGTLAAGKDGFRLSWQLTFAKLTGRATSAYIHEGRPGTHGAALLHLCTPCTSGQTGNGFFSRPELRLARQGRLYVNVRTKRNPSGEIRGQITVS